MHSVDLSNFFQRRVSKRATKFMAGQPAKSSSDIDYNYLWVSYFSTNGISLRLREAKLGQQALESI